MLSDAVALSPDSTMLATDVLGVGAYRWNVRLSTRS